MARFKWAKWNNYETIAPEGVQLFRTHQCEACDFNDEGQCQRCQCLILAKAMMAQERCPVGKWSRVWIKKM